jgi:hypothetical protein
MRRRGLVSNLYRAARLANDVSVLSSGNPHRMARRAKNKIVGRAMARSGLWRRLWGPGRSPPPRGRGLARWRRRGPAQRLGGPA